MIDPVNSLRPLLTKHKAKGIFFVDILGLITFQKHNINPKGVADAKEQLQQLFKEGHYIFPHIHPHWRDSIVIKEKEFDLSNCTQYSLAKLNQEEIDQLFQTCLSFLKELDISYPAWGYRAGGWCMQPFSIYKDVFTKYNILYDFSVLPGYKNLDNNQKFDYTMIRKTSPYNFSQNVEVPDPHGSFVEFPISTMAYSEILILFDRILRKYHWKKNDRGFGDGLSASSAGLMYNPEKKEMLSVEKLNWVKLNAYKNFLKKNNFMHLISHPKMFTQHGLKSLDNFLSYAHKKFSIEYDPLKMLSPRK